MECPSRSSTSWVEQGALTKRSTVMPRRPAIVSAGVSGLGVAWALHQRPDRIDFRLFEAQARIGGMLTTARIRKDLQPAGALPMAFTECVEP